MSGNTGFGADSLAHLEGLAEQVVQRGAGAGFGTSELPRLLYLAEDLGFAQHRRVDAAGNLEEMSGRIGLVKAVEVVGLVVGVKVVAKRLGGQVRDVGKEVAHVAVRAMKPLGVDINLGAIAGAEQHCLEDVRAGVEVVKGLAQVGLGNGELLEGVDGHAAIVYPDDNNRHLNPSCS